MGQIINYKDYRSYPALNYSKLASFSKNPKSLIEPVDISDNDSIKMGSYVDNALFNVESNEKEFIVEDVDRPTGQMGDYCEELANLHIKEEDWTLIDNLGYIEKLEQEAYSKVGFKRDSLEKVLGRFETEGKSYFEFLLNSKDKKVLTKEQHIQCLKAVNTLLTHQFSASILNPVDHCEVRNQIPFIFTHNNTEYKTLTDLLYINHRDKVVFPIDLKTTSESIYSFPGSVWKYRYDIQSSLYTISAKVYVDTVGLQGYTVKPLQFLVYSFRNEKVLLYDSIDINYGGEFGFYDKEGRLKYKGWRQLTEEIKWHMETGLYQYSKEVYESRGLLTLQPPV